jgi:hypothetical protein
VPTKLTRSCPTRRSSTTCASRSRTTTSWRRPRLPVFFSSVRVGREPDADWFFARRTRLNTPIKPALDLGVDRVVEVATHAPDADRLARVVAEVHARHVPGPVGNVRTRDVTLLTRLLRGTSPAHAEPLSYLFFQPQFVSEAIAAGRQDARKLLGSGDPWRTGPIERPGRS